MITESLSRETKVSGSNALRRKHETRWKTFNHRGHRKKMYFSKNSVNSPVFLQIKKYFL
jgi:hypothetical protein